MLSISSRIFILSFFLLKGDKSNEEVELSEIFDGKSKGVELSEIFDGKSKGVELSEISSIIIFFLFPDIYNYITYLLVIYYEYKLYSSKTLLIFVISFFFSKLYGLIDSKHSSKVFHSNLLTSVF